MSLEELLQGFTEKTVTIDELKRKLRALKREAEADENALDHEIRDIAIALMKAVGLDLKPDNLLIVLGALFEAVGMLRNDKHHQRLRKIGKGLEERFATILKQVKAGRDHADAVAIDDDLLVDPQGTEPVDLFVILQKNPTGSPQDENTTSKQHVGDLIDAVASQLSLKRYTHISSRNPVCVLAGEVKPIDVAGLADRYDGVIVRNKSGGKFRGPDPSRSGSQASRASSTEAVPSEPSALEEEGQASGNSSERAANDVASHSDTRSQAPDPLPEADMPDTDQSAEGDGASPVPPATTSRKPPQNAAPPLVSTGGRFNPESYRRSQRDKHSASIGDADLTTGDDDQADDGSTT